MTLTALLALLAALFRTPVHAGEDTDSILMQCASCHGSHGVATTLGIPHLNAQNEDYLLQQIDSLHNGRRSRSTQIDDHVPRQTTPEERAALARHYALADPARPPQPTDAARHAHGEQTYLDRCESCHLDEGRDYAEGKNRYIPKLAGQDMSYLLMQMQGFADGRRPFAALQDGRFSGLDHAHFEDLAHYFASRSPVPPPAAAKKRRRH